MAGISNNLGNLNLRNSLLNSTNKKAEVKEDVKQEATAAKVESTTVKSSQVKVGDINSDTLIAYNGIKIGKPVEDEGPKMETNAHSDGSTKFRKYFNRDALVRDIQNGKTDPNLAFYEYKRSDGSVYHVYYIDGKWEPRQVN